MRSYLEGGAFERRLWRKAFLNGIRVLKRDTRKLPPLLFQVKSQLEGAIYAPESRLCPNTESSLTSDFPTFRTVRNGFLLFIRQQSMAFVTTA